MHLLNVDEIYSHSLPMSEGMVKTAHGLLPVPAPATFLLMCGS